MARVLEALFIIGLTVGGGAAIWLFLRTTVRTVRSGLRVRSLKHPWEIETIDTNDRTEVWLVRGPLRKFCGGVDRDRDDYADRLIQIEAEAESKRDEWNALRKSLNS